MAADTSLQDIAQRALEAVRASRADEGEIYVSRSVRRKVLTKAGRVETVERADTLGVGVRVLRDRRMGFSYASETSKEALREAVQRALSGATLSRRDEDFSFQAAEGPPGSERIPSEFESFEGVPDEERIAKALEIAEAAHSAERRVMFTETHCVDHAAEAAVATTHGFLGGYAFSNVYGYGEAVVREDGEKQAAHELDFSKNFRFLDARRIGRTAAERAAAKLHPTSFPTGRAAVVLAPPEVASLLEALEEALSAENVLKGKSRLEDRLGERVAAPCVTLVEDARDERGPSPLPMDDEGTPTHRTVLIRGGELVSFLHDLRTARKYATSPTGNALRAGFSTTPRITSVQMRLEAGTLGLGGLLREVGEGLHVEELMGLHTVNAVSGEFSLGASGHAIRGGEPAESVSGVALAGNLFDLLGNIALVGGNARYFVSGKETPSLAIEGLTVSGST
ncbi:MAG: TldD/PmbA family protein [Acidobacteriota bacterium]|nr:MAG: TldD/PmbA family protein [Acidobacteriota bacterium]